MFFSLMKELPSGLIEAIEIVKVENKKKVIDLTLEDICESNYVDLNRVLAYQKVSDSNYNLSVMKEVSAQYNIPMSTITSSWRDKKSIPKDFSIFNQINNKTYN